jgi:hypothetical protein
MLAERCPNTPGDFSRREQIELAAGVESADPERGGLRFGFLRRRLSPAPGLRINFLVPELPLNPSITKVRASGAQRIPRTAGTEI